MNLDQGEGEWIVRLKAIMDIIIYGSQHGSAKRYAEGLAEKTSLKAVDYREAEGLGLYKRVIHIRRRS